MDCEKAKLYYYDYLEGAETVPHEVREHLEQCSACQEDMERLRVLLNSKEPCHKPYRPKYLQLHYELLDKWVSCDKVKPFLPLLLIPEMALKHQTPITAHLEKCPACQKDFKAISSLKLTDSELMKAADYLAADQMPDVEIDRQTLAILNHINNRKISNVLTRMRLEHVENAEQMWLSDSYAVEVQYRQMRPVLERRISPHRRPVPVWVKSGIAAAILFAVLLILPTQQDLGAIDLSQIYASLGSVQNVHIQVLEGSDGSLQLDKVDNVHIQVFGNSDELQSDELQNIWIAERIGIRLIKSKDSVVFWDQNSKQVFRRNQGRVELISQGSEMELERPWGLLPFKRISELPASHDWEYISDSTLEDGLQVQIYELTWKVRRSSNNTIIERKWRGYLDVHSHLPYRIEWLDKIDDSPYHMTMMMEVSYPTDAECHKVIENYGFQISYGDQNELLETFPAASNSGATDEGSLLSTWPSTNTALNF